MKPILAPHEVYQDFVVKQLQQHYDGGVLTLVHKDYPIITKLWMTDLTGMTAMLQDFYSARGRRHTILLPCSVLICFFCSLSRKSESLLGWMSCSSLEITPPFNSRESIK